MIMTYVKTRFDDETYKHIFTRLNKNFSRRYLIVDGIEKAVDTKKTKQGENTK